MSVCVCACVCVCVCLLIFFFILFAPSSCSGTSSAKTSIFLGLFLYCCTFVSLCRSFCLCMCLCVCVGLPAASATYLNFTRAYTGKDKRDLYPLMPVICSIKLLYAADTLRADLRASLPYTRCSFFLFLFLLLLPFSHFSCHSPNSL